MSDDLISRKALIEEINSLYMSITGLRAGKAVLIKFMEEYKKTVLKCIDEAQTAYDVDAVCNEIKKREKKFREYGEKYHDGEGISAADACAGDIEIVRNGGKKE